MAKANAVTGTTLYIPEGGPLPGPDELHPDVRLVGPGAPAAVAEPEPAAAGPADAVPGEESPEPAQTSSAPPRPNVNAPKADWVTYAVAVDGSLGYDAADVLPKAELVSRYGAR